MKDYKIGDSMEQVSSEPIAKIIEKLANELSVISNETLLRVTEKLRPVVNCSVEPPLTDNIHIKQYPPLFESLRCSLDIIGRNLAGVNECLDRVEL